MPAAFINSRRGSTTSFLSRSSSMSDCYDHHGNRAGPQSASRLSSVSDVSIWEHLDHLVPARESDTPQTELISKPFPSGHTYRNTPTPPSPVQPTIPIRRFSSQNTDANLTIYTSPPASTKMKSNVLPSSGRGVSSPTASADFSPPNLTANRTSALVGVANSDLIKRDHVTGIGASVGVSSSQPAIPDNGSNPGLPLTFSVVDQHPTSSVALHSTPALSNSGSHSSSVALAQPPGLHPSMVTPTHSSPHSPRHAMKLSSLQRPSDLMSLPSGYSPHPVSLHANPMPHESPPSPPASPTVPISTSTSCVQVGVQLEPDHYSSHAPRTLDATEHYTQQQPVHSTSNLRPAVQSSFGSNVWPVSYSHSNMNFPSYPSNLHVSRSQASTLPPAGIPDLNRAQTSTTPHLISSTGTSQIPNIKVDVASSGKVAGQECISQMRRLGHVRHSSLGQNTSCQQKRQTHSRNRSLGSINTSHIQPMSTLNSTHGSCSNLSLMSNASICGSELSTGSNFLKTSQLTKIPDPDIGYDFAQHFNLFSQYTSNMALEYCVSGRGSEEWGPVVPPVWCMGFWNRVVAVGCSNGQVEVSCFTNLKSCYGA